MVGSLYLTLGDELSDELIIIITTNHNIDKTILNYWGINIALHVLK